MNEVAYAFCELKYTLYSVHEALVYCSLEPIFSEYIKLLSSLKIRNAVVPQEFQHDVAAYCSQVNDAMSYTTEADRLTPEKMQNNPYAYKFFKGVLNISLGKFSQTDLHPQVEYVHEEERLSQLYNDGTIDILSCFLVTEKTMQVTYQKKETCLKVNKRSQVVLHAMVTSLSRVYMYRHLRLLERNGADLLYIDTDGIIFGLARDKKEQVFDYGRPQGEDQGDIRKMRVHPAIFGYFKNEILPTE